MKKKTLLAAISAGILAASCMMQGAVCAQSEETAATEAAPYGLPEEGTALVDITMEGGSGKAYIQSPVEVTVKDGAMTARLVWSSKNYDYMLVDGVRYENENSGGNSVFTIPVATLEEPLTVIGDTVAMSTPHEIEYVITWNTENEGDDSAGQDESHGNDGSDPEEAQTLTDSAAKESLAGSASAEALGRALEDAGHACTKELVPDYAVGFRAGFYDDYTVICIDRSGIYLLVPEDGDIPEGLPEDTVILQKPLDHTYLVSTSVMDLLRVCGVLDRVRLSGTKESDWYIEEAKEAMQRGDILYAGKYRAPDYETILAEGCDLAIENTMIYHEPAAKAKLEELGIPVLVETSSYETHPLGRLEWIRLYGLLFDKEEEADAWFKEQLDILEPLLKEKPDTGKSAAFFYVAGNGMINVRKPGDYITRMIELSGGHYILPDTEESENALSTMNMQMEDFYAAACEADVILYNSTIGGEISSIAELIAKNPLFADFKAVKEGEVYCVERGFFQHTTGMAAFIRDLGLIWDGEGDDYTWLRKLV